MILRFWKIALHNKIINKTRSTKNQENSTHRFVNNYRADHHIKILQNKTKFRRVRALRICTGYHFFKRTSLVRALFPLTFRVVHVKGVYIKYVRGGAGGFYKFFKKKNPSPEDHIDLYSWPSNFFRKYFMAPTIHLVSYLRHTCSSISR